MRNCLFWMCLIALLLTSVTQSVRGAEQQATPVSSIRVQPGFQVELLRSAQAGESSWISMTFDDRGRVILGLDDVGLGRLTLNDKTGKVAFEKIDDKLKHCRGVLYAHDSLYISETNGEGLHRFRDTNGDDQFDQRQLLKPLDYRSRFGHGSNQLVLGPDKNIYLVVGNDVSFPEGVSPQSPYRDPQNDQLLPNPHDAGQDNRVGYILKTDPAGKTWEILAGDFGTRSTSPLTPKERCLLTTPTWNGISANPGIARPASIILFPAASMAGGGEPVNGPSIMQTVCPVRSIRGWVLRPGWSSAPRVTFRPASKTPCISLTGRMDAFCSWI